jgi:hypothetical protein
MQKRRKEKAQLFQESGVSYFSESFCHSCSRYHQLNFSAEISDDSTSEVSEDPAGSSLGRTSLTINVCCMAVLVVTFHCCLTLPQVSPILHNVRIASQLEEELPRLQS